MQEKESIMEMRGGQTNPSLAIIVWHHSVSLVMPDSDPRIFLSTPHTNDRSLYVGFGKVPQILTARAKENS